MDKQLQGISPVPSDVDKVIKTSAVKQQLWAFLFEPKYLVPFDKAWIWQREWQQYLFANPQAPQALLLLEHTNCYTLGRGGNDANLLFDLEDPSVDWHRIDRGGDATHHLPGQLVAYPVLDLKGYRMDLHWYLRQLEEVLINVLFVLGLEGERLPGLTGIWCEGKKVGAIGVGCRRWITQHGLSLNVDCDLGGFAKVVPCGLSGCRIGRLNDWVPGLTVSDVRPLMINAFEDCFGLDFRRKEFLPIDKAFTSIN